MKNYNKYETKLAYPDRGEIRKKLTEKFDKREFTTGEDAREFMSDLPRKIEEEYRLGRDAYREEQHRLHQVVFKQDLREEHGLSPAIGDIIFQKAWDDGHSSGLPEVAYYYDSFVTFYEQLKTAENGILS